MKWFNATSALQIKSKRLEKISDWVKAFSETISNTAEVSAALEGIATSCAVSGNGGSTVPSRYCLPFTQVRR